MSCPEHVPGDFCFADTGGRGIAFEDKFQGSGIKRAGGRPPEPIGYEETVAHFRSLGDADCEIPPDIGCRCFPR